MLMCVYWTHEFCSQFLHPCSSNGYTPLSLLFAASGYNLLFGEASLKTCTCKTEGYGVLTYVDLREIDFWDEKWIELAESYF